MANYPLSYFIDRAQLSIWSKEDIKEVSVKKITDPKSFEKGGAVSPEGLYSPALGPSKRFDLCNTCGLSGFNCSGHYGHIDLSVPVYHPMLVQVLYQILNKACFQCFHFRLPKAALKLFLAQIEALNCGFDHLIDEFNEIAADMYRDGHDDDPRLHSLLGKRLTDRIDEEKEKTPDFDCQRRLQQRSIVERLSQLFRCFLNGSMVKPMKICPNCQEKKTSISLHQNSVMVVGTNSSKAINELDDLSVRKRSKKHKSSKSKKPKHEPITFQNLSYIVTDDKRYLTPIGAKHYLKQLWYNEKQTMRTIFRFLDMRTEIEKDKLRAKLKKEKAAAKSKNIDLLKEFREEDDGLDGDKIKEEEDIDPDFDPNKCKETEEKDEPIAELEEDDLKKKVKPSNDFHPVDNFFVETILVPPSKFRPSMMQNGYSFEGPRTGALSNVLKQSNVVQEMLDQIFSEIDIEEVEKLQIKLQAVWKALQVAVNSVYDNELDKYGKQKYPGLKQLIDKKEGLFRKNMMGKRVNFAARSVISPDPNISVDQIGVPLVFAKKLTYPEAVTPMNLAILRQAVMNGPDKYPGAHSVTFDDGITISLIKESVRHQIAAKLTHTPRPPSFRQKVQQQTTPLSTIVNRHLVTGDVLLFNRQPTLHKPSIMAFRARVLPNEKGFRLHYANCKSFNADFDGDEMNAHLPQNELARSEAYNIASVNYQYLVPKDGSPLGGLIQDHVVAVCILTNRDKFLDKERYYQLVYCALASLEKPIVYEPPTIIKPTYLWTGKQVITSIIKNCIPNGKQPPTLNIKSKIEPKLLHIKPEFNDLSDCNVIIRNGELLKGFMDKTNVGATQYGLIHLCYELYGGETSSALMSAFARLSTIYLQMYEGFTLGIKDIVVDCEANVERKKLINESTFVGPESAREALNIKSKTNGGDKKDSEENLNDNNNLDNELPSCDDDFQLLEDKMRDAHSDRDPLPMKLLDGSMKQRTDKYASSISKRCLPTGLIVPFPDNNLQMMIQSGAKGGTVNALQISCLLGQIELEGRRVPLSMSGRSLPSFRPYDPSPKAGGFVTGRFLTGIQPQEFFFHCMAGREGLIDTAVKTSRSGYLQRCLIKHLEGITVHYDQTVRDSCGSVIQFLYGEDGLDIVRSQLLKEKAFTSLVNNYNIVKPSDEELDMLAKAKELYEEEVIAHSDLIQQWLELNGGTGDSNNIADSLAARVLRKGRGSGFLDFLNTKLEEERAKALAEDDDGQIIDLDLQSSPRKYSAADDDGTKKVSSKSATTTTMDKEEEEEAKKGDELAVKKEKNSNEHQLAKDEKMSDDSDDDVMEVSAISSSLSSSKIKNDEISSGGAISSKLQAALKDHSDNNSSSGGASLYISSFGGSDKVNLRHPHDHIFRMWYALSFKEKRKWNKFWEACPDPLTALMNPASHFGVVPERLDQLIETFARKNPQLIIDPASFLDVATTSSQTQQLSSMDAKSQIILGQQQLSRMNAYADNPELGNLLHGSTTTTSTNQHHASPSINKHQLTAITNANLNNINNNNNNKSTFSSNNGEQAKLTKHEFYNICYNLYMKMVAQPGEAVGLLAAQSIGEPSTQMTLNTFHFAGRGEMNVTLGIPRLREILMTASAKIGTPSMDLPGLPHMKDDAGNELDSLGAEKQMNKVRLALNAVRLSDVLEYMDISEQVIPFEEIFKQLHKDNNNKFNAVSTIFNSSISSASSKGKKRKRSGDDATTTTTAIASGRKSSAKAAADDDDSRKAIKYELTLRILPSRYYKHEFQCNSTKVMKFIEETFIGQLIGAMTLRQKRLMMGETIFDVSSKRGILSTSSKNANNTTSTSNKQTGPNKNITDDSKNIGDNGEDMEEYDLDKYNAQAVEDENGAADGDNANNNDDDDDDDDNVNANDDLSSSDDDDLQQDIGHKKKSTNNAQADGDNTTAKLKSRRDQDLDYEEPEDEDLEVGELETTGAREERDNVVEILLDNDEDENDLTMSKSSKKLSDDSNDLAGSKTIDLANPLIDTPSPDLIELDESKKQSKKSGSSKEPIESHFYDSNPHVLQLLFDAKKERWCKVTLCFELMKSRLDMGALLDHEARKTYIHRVGNIQRALIVDDNDAKSRGSNCLKMIKTEGVSLLSLVRFNHIIDLNAIYSNDIHAIANTYGIEAAAQAIRREMANVFAVYGIQVDSRHLSLIADYMTYSGYIRGMNRMSMEASASPFQQMSFESTLRYLRQAALLGFHDDIKSPSAALVFGRPTRGGTGICAPMADSNQCQPDKQENRKNTKKKKDTQDDVNVDEDADDDEEADNEENWDISPPDSTKKPKPETTTRTNTSFSDEGAAEKTLNWSDFYDE